MSKSFPSLKLDLYSPNLLKTRGREIVCYNDRITLQFDRHLDSAATAVPVKFQSDWKPGDRLNKKDGLTRYDDSHVKDKTS